MGERNKSIDQKFECIYESGVEEYLLPLQGMLFFSEERTAGR
jgi:hypothetical protein